MSQYVITIVPVPEDGEPAGPASQTIVRIESVSGRASVTELTMRAPEGAGLVTGELPYVNFEMLLQAFVPKHDVGIESIAAPGTEALPTANQARAVRQPVKSLPIERGAAKQTTSNRAPQPGHLRPGRAYRRMPDPSELETAYDETGTIAGVATHFGVPVHTAQGWISRLRRKNAESTNSA